MCNVRIAAPVLLMLLVSAQALHSQTNIPSGTITADTTWDLSGSPFIVACGGVTVASGVTLTIQSGVVVKFQNCGTSSFIAVNGSLVANGTPTQIVFTSVLEGTATPPSPGNWGGI